MSLVSNPDIYRLIRSPLSSCRLNAQHYLWRRTCGFNLHPRILSPAYEALRIADIGTGTGIWMDDVRHQLGSVVTIDGYDKSMEQCPPPELCPQGCTISQLDISLDIPERLRDVYDVVNARLIQGGLEDDPAPALRNMISMLKPGGFLQWQEINLSALSVATANPSSDQTAMQHLLGEVREFGFGKWTPRLAEICTENGLLEARTDRYRVPPEVSIPFCQTQLMAYEEISWVAMDNTSPDSRGPRFRGLLQEVYKELNTGVWLDHGLEITTAVKPG